jgi:A/G-specific adenine glycosylase
VKSARARVESVREVAVVITRAGLFLIARRPPDAARWQNMWEFPQTSLSGDETHEQAATRWSRESLGLTIRPGAEITTVRYAVTRYRLTLTALRATTPGRPQPAWYTDSTWAAPDALARYPMSNAQRKLADAVRGGAAGLF